jgi:aspartate/methionine/tyrosine aminotransferase
MHPALAMLIRADIPAKVNSLSMDVLPYLESKLLDSERLGIKIKAMLIPNPHNPIPQVVPKEVIKGYALLAQKVSISSAET